MQEIVDKIHSLLYSKLTMDVPVLSGNMSMNISANGSEIIIDAPFYDMKRWLKDGTIIHTGRIINGKTAYAEWVNRLGGFATHNDSEGWVNRAVLDVVNIIANEIGAEVIDELQ